MDIVSTFGKDADSPAVSADRVNRVAKGRDRHLAAYVIERSGVPVRASRSSITAEVEGVGAVQLRSSFRSDGVLVWDAGMLGQLVRDYGYMPDDAFERVCRNNAFRDVSEREASSVADSANQALDDLIAGKRSLTEIARDSL